MTTVTPESRALAALGHDARLSIFRLLVRAGNAGLNVGQIGTHLNVPASTLAHHLGALVDAGLVRQERLGREVVNRADFDAIRRIAEFLVAECCKGVPVLESEAAAK